MRSLKSKLSELEIGGTSVDVDVPPYSAIRAEIVGPILQELSFIQNAVSFTMKM